MRIFIGLKSCAGGQNPRKFTLLGVCAGMGYSPHLRETPAYHLRVPLNNVLAHILKFFGQVQTGQEKTEAKKELSTF